MLNQILPESSMGPRTGLDARSASSIYIKTAFLNFAQSFVSCDSDHIIQNGKKQTSIVQSLLQKYEE